MKTKKNKVRGDYSADVHEQIWSEIDVLKLVIKRRVDDSDIDMEHHITSSDEDDNKPEPQKRTKTSQSPVL